MPCSCSVWCRLSLDSMWCKASFAPCLRGSCSDTIRCTSRPRVALWTLSVSPSPVKHSTSRSIKPSADVLTSLTRFRFIGQGIEWIYEWTTTLVATHCLWYTFWARNKKTSWINTGRKLEWLKACSAFVWTSETRKCKVAMYQKGHGMLGPIMAVIPSQSCSESGQKSTGFQKQETQKGRAAFCTWEAVVFTLFLGLGFGRQKHTKASSNTLHFCRKLKHLICSGCFLVWTAVNFGPSH